MTIQKRNLTLADKRKVIEVLLATADRLSPTMDATYHFLMI